MLARTSRRPWAATTSPTVEGLAAALSNDPAEAGSVVGQFAHGEFLLTLSNFQTSISISSALNLSEDSAGISLQIGSPPTLSGNATVSTALTFGYDTGTVSGAIESGQRVAREIRERSALTRAAG